MNVRKWREAWLFLSLEAIEPYYTDLWVRLAGGEFREGVCQALEPWLNSEEYFTDFGRANFHLSLWLTERYGTNEFRYLSDWVERVLLASGPERLAETAWSVFVYTMATSGDSTKGVSAEVRARLANVRTEHSERKSELEARIATIPSPATSAWDTRILALQESALDDAFNVLRLTTDCNVFVEAWEHHCGELTVGELDRLHALGKELAKGSQMDKLGDRHAALYPGTWRSELLPLIPDLTRQVP